jgi:hypothetical protein
VLPFRVSIPFALLSGRLVIVLPFIRQLNEYVHIVGFWFGIVAAGLTAIEHFYILRHKKREVEELKTEVDNKKREVQELKTEVDKLHDQRSVESVRLVGRKLQSVDIPVCPVCNELLQLKFAPTYLDAIERLADLPSAIEQSIIDSRIEIKLLHESLSKVLHNTLWEVKPENPVGDRCRPDPEKQVITQSVAAYRCVVAHMTEQELELAIALCVDASLKGSLDLQQELVSKLLPRLLVDSKGHSKLVQHYIKLLQICQTDTLDQEKKTLLTALLGGMQLAVTVESEDVRQVTEVRQIWGESFDVLTRNINWAWGRESEGESGGTIWCNAIEDRLKHADLGEKEFLRKLTGHYLEKDPAATTNQWAYRAIARLNHKIRSSIDPSIPDFRVPDRAIVPVPLPVQISFRDNSASMDAKILNFSLAESHGKTTGRGAWAISEEPSDLPLSGEWRAASVSVRVTPTEGAIVFANATVRGPIREEEGANRYYGFRIKLGPSSPESAISPLKARWDSLIKR